MTDNLQPTERLYYRDSHLLKFQARVLECRPADQHWVAVLDRSAFYPTGGGQPFDTGQLGTARVLDCIDHDQYIHHVVDQAISGYVEGLIDPLRRRDHLQQHTGQHILSQAFIKIANAETRGFHLGEQSSTIDIELENPTPELIARAEQMANDIVFDNRPVRIHLTDEQSLDQFSLRKETERSGCIRVIEIEDFDQSPCGGTHAHRTGEVGLIVVRSFERAKKMCRIEFLCGQRALNDYRASQRSAMATAMLFSAGRDSAPELVAKLQQEQKQLQRRQKELLELALESEARRLYEATETTNNIRVIKAIWPQRGLEEVKMLAHLLVAQGPVIALLAIPEETVRLIFARSKDLAADCGKLLSGMCQQLGGRGGGRADFAQGGVPAESNWQTALTDLTQSLTEKN